MDGRAYVRRVLAAIALPSALLVVTEVALPAVVLIGALVEAGIMAWAGWRVVRAEAGGLASAAAAGLLLQLLRDILFGGALVTSLVFAPSSIILALVGGLLARRAGADVSLAGTPRTPPL